MSEKREEIKGFLEGVLSSLTRSTKFLERLNKENTALVELQQDLVALVGKPDMEEVLVVDDDGVELF